MATEESIQNKICTNQFMLDLTKSLYFDEEKNLLVSPFSLSSALSMVLFGTSEHTRQELLNVLFKNNKHAELAHKDQQAFDAFMETYAKDLTKFFKENESVLSNANLIYGRKGFPIKEKYIKQLTQQFSTILKQMDFGDPATVKVINEDVSKATKGLIPDILDSINPSHCVILINAIHFKGMWKYPFNKDQVHDGDFFQVRPDGSTNKIKVKMMFCKKEFPYYICMDSKLTAVRLEYSSGSVSMVILLPDKSVSVKQMLETLDQDKLSKILDQMGCLNNVELTIPKFKMEASHNLVPYLASLGVNTLFDSSKAKLDGVSEEPLFVSDIVQKAVIDVNEEGTEAAAATRIMMMRCCLMDPGPTIIKVDRPFVYLLVSNDNNHVLFSGVINKPEYLEK